MDVERYPGWRFHRTETARIVNNAEEDAALGEGWAHSPADFEEDAAPAAGQPAEEPAAPSTRRRR